MFIKLRQETNGVGGKAGKKAKDIGQFTVTSMRDTNTITYDSAEKAVKAATNKVKLVFKKYGINVDFFAVNNLKMNELRIGHSCMPISCNDGASKNLPVSKYRLHERHQIVLERCT